MLKTRNLPSVVTTIRLGLVPPLVFLVSNGMLTYGAMVFLSLLATDLLDGYLARRLCSSSSFGAYFDAMTDFLLVFSMFLVFDSKGFVPDWVLIVIGLFFAQFAITSLGWGRIYDPIGKYYGSLLYGAIGLRFFVTGELFYDVATIVIMGFAAVSMSARVLYFRWGEKSAWADC